MSALAVMLIAMGIADVVRRLTRPWCAGRVVAPVVVIGCVATGRARGTPATFPLLVLAAAASVAWVVLCARAERSGEHELAPLAVFGAAVAAADSVVRLGFRRRGLVAAVVVWVEVPGIGGVEPEPAADGRRCGAAAVRDGKPVGAAGARLRRRGEARGPAAAVGPTQGRPVARPDGAAADPRARLAGQLAAATAVVAAKSIIRFPEINAQKARENGNYRHRRQSPSTFSSAASRAGSSRSAASRWRSQQRACRFADFASRLPTLTA